MSKQNNFLCLVLKSQASRERDLLVTLISREQGRVVVSARGARQLGSSKRAYLQAGNLVHVHLVETKGLPILTQAQLVADTLAVRTDLRQVKRLLLFLEILDRLLVGEELPAAQFQRIITLRELMVRGISNRVIKEHFEQLLASLGYYDERHGAEPIIAQVNSILDTRLRSFDYLSLDKTSRG